MRSPRGLGFLGYFFLQATPKSDIPPNIAPKVVIPEKYLHIWLSSATLIGQLATVTTFGAMLSGIPLSGSYPYENQNSNPFGTGFQILY